MANKASQELAALNSMQGDVAEVEDAQTALQRTQSEQQARQSPDSEAQFGTPEAIATAVLGSVILGPVGGILLGGAQGWLKKRGEQKILDQLADEQTLLSGANDVYANQLTAFKGTAQNDNDLEQIATMETGLDVARQFMLSADPTLREKGIQMQAGIDQEMNAYANRQETQSIAAEAKRAELIRATDQETYRRYEGNLADFDSQSAPYIERKFAANAALEALQGGSPAQIHQAMILFNKTLDPNSAVLSEERTAIEGMGTLLDTAYNLFGEKFTGQKLNADQRRDLGEAILNISDQSDQFQSMREARFAERNDTAGLSNDMKADFSITQNIPGAEQVNIPDDFKDTIADAPRDIVEAVKTGTATGFERGVQWVADDLAKAQKQAVGAAEATRDFYQGAGEVVGDKVEQAENFIKDVIGFSSGGSRPTN